MDNIGFKLLCLQIKSYPRVIETSVRTKDTRRAEKRKEKLEKKRKVKFFYVIKLS